MNRLFNQDYSLVHPKVLVDHDRARVALQIYSVLKNSHPDFIFKTANCLDAGCSNGVIAKYFSRYVQRIVGIDIDQNAIKLGQSLYQNRRLHLMPFAGNRIPFPKNTFDLVILRRTYGSAEDPEKLTDEIWRVLKPDGLVYFEGNSPFSPRMILPPKLLMFIYFLLGRETYYLGRYRTARGLVKMFSRFKIHRLTPEIVKEPHRFKFRKHYRLAPFTRWLPLTLLRRLEFFFPVYIWVLEKPTPFGRFPENSSSRNL